MAATMVHITELLKESASGDHEARERLFAAIYDDLRKIAAKHVRLDAADLSLGATDLVHQVYPQLIRDLPWQTRAHFFAYAARAIRHALIDHARRKRADRHGANLTRVTLTDLSDDHPSDLLDLDRAMHDLAKIAPRQAHILEYHYLGGMTVGEIAHFLELSEVTIYKELKLAKLWLFRALGRAGRSPWT